MTRTRSNGINFDNIERVERILMGNEGRVMQRIRGDKMTNIEETDLGRWTVQSFTERDKTYDVRRLNEREKHKFCNSNFSCSCMSWRFNSRKDRTCKHTDCVEQYILTRKEHVTVEGKRFIVLEVQKSRIEMISKMKDKDLEDTF